MLLVKAARNNCKEQSKSNPLTKNVMHKLLNSIFDLASFLINMYQSKRSNTKLRRKVCICYESKKTQKSKRT